MLLFSCIFQVLRFLSVSGSFYSVYFCFLFLLILEKEFLIHDSFDSFKTPPTAFTACNCKIIFYFIRAETPILKPYYNVKISQEVELLLLGCTQVCGTLPVISIR